MVKNFYCLRRVSRQCMLYKRIQFCNPLGLEAPQTIQLFPIIQIHELAIFLRLCHDLWIHLHHEVLGAKSIQHKQPILGRHPFALIGKTTSLNVFPRLKPPNRKKSMKEKVEPRVWSSGVAYPNHHLQVERVDARMRTSDLDPRDAVVQCPNHLQVQLHRVRRGDSAQNARTHSTRRLLLHLIESTQCRRAKREHRTTLLGQI